MRRIYPADEKDLDSKLVYSDLVFPDAPPNRPYLVLNMVSTVDGKATIDGRAAPIGTRADYWAMRNLRTVADAVMSGAGTLRLEGFDPTVPPELAERRRQQGKTPQPIGVVVSETLDLPFDRAFFEQEGFKRLVITGTHDDARLQAIGSRAIIMQSSKGQVNLAEALGKLRREFGVSSLIVEGGPNLNYSLLAEHLVDELFWTVAPKVIGGPGLTLVEGKGFPTDHVIKTELLTAYAHESEIFLRYRFLRET